VLKAKAKRRVFGVDALVEDADLCVLQVVAERCRDTLMGPSARRGGLRGRLAFFPARAYNSRMAPDAAGRLEYLSLPPSPETALAALPDFVRAWFAQRFGQPTVAQRLAWPAIHAGRNLLLCAPTGTGKTLAACLPVLGELLTRPPAAGVSCLYVSPLKALTNDVRANLRAYLAGLAAFHPAGSVAPRVRARTGDTPARARRQMLVEPPDVLLTTPESLAVLLTGRAAADMLGAVRWVVVDEVHALAGNKRGADLSLSLERLEDLAGGLQRVGLSATCAPVATAARFLAGSCRPCTIAQAPEAGPLHVHIEPLPELGGSLCNRLVARLAPELEAAATTLVFTNARGLAERLAWALRQRFPAWDELIGVHHSCLAAPRRRAVERRLKHGLLRAVISSTSLELGIDVGAVENVVLVHPPGGVVRLLQRVGRGGHAPGRPRRGLVLTASTADLLEAAATASSCESQQYEPLRLPAAPLDVLCQHLLGLATQGLWEQGRALELARRAAPYQDLTDRDYTDCLNYLSGRHANGRTWLPARLRWEGDRFTVADERTARVLRRNVGTILGEELRPVRLADGAGVGEVDESFAERLQPGDRFLLDGRCLELRRLGGTALEVEEVMGRPAPPRWAGDAWPCSAELARRLYLLRTRAAEALLHGPAKLADLLRREYGLGGPAADALLTYFQLQEAVSEIPDAGACLVECVSTGTGTEYYIHTPLSRPGNDALARVAVHRLVRRRGVVVVSAPADLGFLLCVEGQGELGAEDVRWLLSRPDFDADLAAALRDSDLLRERFRRTALTGLMLLRNPLGRRRRVGGQDWPERRLFEQVRAAEAEFVLLRQALREVREECLDVAAARAYAEEMPRRVLRCRRLVNVSPFAEAWTQQVVAAAETAGGPAEALLGLHAELTGGEGQGGRRV
jgi:ATP-dependent Lhr-like helicase